MKRKTTLRSEKTVDGQVIRPPKKGELAGAWVVTKRRRLDAVEFGGMQGAYILVYFFDELHRIRILADGTKELGYAIEKCNGKLDIRNDLPPEVSALILSGGIIARSLGDYFQAHEAQIEMKRRERARKLQRA